MREIFTLEEVAAHDGEIVCAGAGMVLAHIEDLIKIYMIDLKIVAIVDNNPKRQGQTVWYCGRQYIIQSFENIKELGMVSPLILITCERFAELVDGIKNDVFFKDWIVACYPKLNYDYMLHHKSTVIFKGGSPKIPKTIHYLWFGNNKIPDKHQKYIDKARDLCNDYQFMFWSESNYNIGNSQYMKEAYKAGDYARVSDYARLDILYQYGGFYMDTDVELIKSLDALRHNSVVLTYGEWPVVNSGVICGAEPRHELIRQMRDDPRSRIGYFDDNGEPDNRTNCYYENNIMVQMGFKGDFSYQSINGITIYPPDYFASAGIYRKDLDLSPNTIAVHHCVGSWKRR